MISNEEMIERIINYNYKICGFCMKVCEQLREKYGYCFWISGYPLMKLKLMDKNRTVCSISGKSVEENVERIGKIIEQCNKDPRYIKRFKQ